MTRLYFVRHAKPAATWGEATDSGLDEEGRAQAEAAALTLHSSLSAAAILTSPLRRCVETAAPLAALWRNPPSMFEAVAEIPAPALPMEKRREWLAVGMQGSWRQLQANSPAGSPDYLAWRNRLLAAVSSLPQSSVIYSHYIAINVVVGAAQGSDRVISFSPGHASITVIEVDDGNFRVERLGAEATGGGILLGK